ncbi:YbaB/EbfC family nucleoid-associated protein [Micromonosporaceae bacterium Da 78-11]
MDPEDAVDDWAARAERQTALTVELSERLQQARASAESRGGEVAVTVDHSGGLADIGLSEQAMRLSARELSEMVLATSRRAQAKLAEQVNDLVGALYGAGSETASFIGQTYSEQFPEPADEDKDEERER